VLSSDTKDNILILFLVTEIKKKIIILPSL